MEISLCLAQSVLVKVEVGGLLVQGGVDLHVVEVEGLRNLLLDHKRVFPLFIFFLVQHQNLRAGLLLNGRQFEILAVGKVLLMMGGLDFPYELHLNFWSLFLQGEFSSRHLLNAEHRFGESRGF
jgi:hypothetical protein